MSRYFYRTILVALIIAFGVGLYGLTAYLRQDTSEFTKVFALDTVVSIRAYGAQPRDLEAAIARMRDAEQRLDRHHPGSEIARLNREGRLSSGALSEQTLSLLRTSLRMAEATGGGFDPTIAPLVDAWDIDGENRIPSESQLSKLLSQVGYQNLLVSEERVGISGGGTVDLGGILKGYAVDQAITELQGRGATGALVSAVSSAKVLGAKPGGEPWRVGVENPRPGRGPGLIAVLDVHSGESVSTSGDYQRYFEKAGRRYHHILHPETGLPSSGLMSLTLVAKRSAAETDALSTGLFAQGHPDGWQQVLELEGVDALAVTLEGDVLLTAGMRGRASEVVNRLPGEPASAQAESSH